MGGYGWTNYDPRTGGSQNIEDTKSNLRLTTEFLKKPGGATGGNWHLRIRGLPVTKTPNLRTVVVFYIGSENQPDTNDPLLECRTIRSGNRSSEPISFNGHSSGLGSFNLLLQALRSPMSNSQNAFTSIPHEISVASITVPRTTIWKAKG